MRLSEALNAQGVEGRGAPMQDEWIFVVCPQCHAENCLAQARIDNTAAQTLYCCINGCPAPIWSVDNASGASLPGGTLSFRVPESAPGSENFMFGRTEGF